MPLSALPPVSTSASVHHRPYQQQRMPAPSGEGHAYPPSISLTSHSGRRLHLARATPIPHRPHQPQLMQASSSSRECHTYPHRPHQAQMTPVSSLEGHTAAGYASRVRLCLYQPSPSPVAADTGIIFFLRPPPFPCFFSFQASFQFCCCCSFCYCFLLLFDFDELGCKYCVFPSSLVSFVQKNFV